MRPSLGGFISVSAIPAPRDTRVAFFPLLQSSLTGQLIQPAGVQHPFYHKLIPLVHRLIPFTHLNVCLRVTNSTDKYVSVCNLFLPLDRISQYSYP